MNYVFKSRRENIRRETQISKQKKNNKCKREKKHSEKKKLIARTYR